MPVLVELISLPTYQDQEDLQKIYRDAPDDLFAPFVDASQLIETALTEQALLAGRFNDRLLGAALLQRSEKIWWMSHLCVRKPTRRRGVAERIVVHAQKLALEAGCELRLLTTVERPEVLALAARLNVPTVLEKPAGSGTCQP
ncbi:acetyl-CoA sensor PanZ family protein [Pseudomonas sp. CDFA 602]|uniref:acetyl-CoA sensor PanZ family protein n=1 Tax=Pseudomonas californiensis TaxID=2829823 RepID=UPI001E29182E|nr:acetyl-CoA sensor PanZ family protein [Pseudomonas californiensis]MCD5996722.1 acetyl-CoA sensor PanZ family protein [Pseudomonas californiensis]MCD6002320.1 acetyl-CoA sensor PanZ family protein [Pseudomonas californiensis]